jgi:hypothetical protein
MESCPECGRPLERADDFWYCDNPDCLGRGAGSRPPKEDGPPGGFAAGPKPEESSRPVRG